MAKKTNEALDIVFNLKQKTIQIPIESDTPLIVSRFDEKCKTEIAEKAPGKLKQGKKKPESPEEQYEKSLYYMADKKRTGFPAVAFKAAMVRAAQVVYDMQMVKTRTLFHVLADEQETGLIEIHGEHRMREDMVRVGAMTKVASPRYRAEFPKWTATISIRYVEGALTEDQIIGLLNAAGFCCGVGEWRPEKCNSGSFGLFHVVQG